MENGNAYQQDDSFADDDRHVRWACRDVRASGLAVGAFVPGVLGVLFRLARNRGNSRTYPEFEALAP
jgi:hypothetical protein